MSAVFPQTRQNSNLSFELEAKFATFYLLKLDDGLVLYVLIQAWYGLCALTNKILL